MIKSSVKCGVKLRIHSQTSMVPPLKFGNGWFIHRTSYWGCNYLSMLKLTLNHVSKSIPVRPRLGLLQFVNFPVAGIYRFVIINIYVKVFKSCSELTVVADSELIYTSTSYVYVVLWCVVLWPDLTTFGSGTEFGRLSNIQWPRCKCRVTNKSKPVIKWPNITQCCL